MGFALRNDDALAVAPQEPCQERRSGALGSDDQPSKPPGVILPDPKMGAEVSAKADRAANVVLVEDDPAVRQVAAMILDFLGYGVVEFDDPSAALTYLAQDATVALLFTDVRLPGEMCGTSLALEARRLRPDLAILLTTGNISEVAPHVMRRLPGAEMLLKPYGRSRLQRMVASATARAGTSS